MLLQIDDPKLDRAFAALSDPVRRQLLEDLSHGPRAAGALAEPFDISRPAVSRHLRVLREAGLVTVQVEGRERRFSIDPEGVTEVETWLGELRGLWRDSLHELKALVEGDGS